MKLVNRHFLKTLLCGWLAVVSMAGTAHAWWNSEWTLRKKITLDTSDKGVGVADAVGTTTVLIRLYEGNFQFPSAKEDGSDLRFVAGDDKTPLAYHIEKYDSLMGEAFVWVKVPDIKPGSQVSFWLYYGNGSSQAAKAEDAKGSFDADTVLVYHFGEHGQPAHDFTASGNDAKNAGTPAEGSMIGSGLRLDGHTAITIPAAPSLAWADNAALTWSAWIKFGALKTNAVIFSRRDGAKAFIIGADNGVPYVEVTDANGTKRSEEGAAFAANGWRHLAVVAGGGRITLFVDGETYNTFNAVVPSMNTAAMIAGDTAMVSADASASEAGVTGELDELEISKVARPAGQIKLAAVGQSDKGAKLLVFGENEQASNWMSWLKGGYFGVIIGSLTLDGWIVIGILMGMAAMSWYVMISKASYLNAASKGNSLFMKEWRHIATDLTVLDDGDAEAAKTLGGRVDKAGQRAMRNSAVFRIYHIGVEEIRHRLALDASPGKKALKNRSIQAIRASLDSGLVRETQKLNAQMVLLTIAISGGPFLGLLGTVVGVMITFAAVAAAGDVNVNAIAPGIAAALLATVAGLAVAIPSLFGYNYLLAQVKDATSDMHVFIDEFVTRMAEFYGGKAE